MSKTSFLKLNLNLLLFIFILFSAGLSKSAGLGINTGYESKSAINDNLVIDAIRPYSNNPWYFQFRGEPRVLIGGSDEDNLFQWTGKKLTDHLDLLDSVGGNYLRNTMSDRDEGNVFAFRQIEENGAYDLDEWNPEYWNRLEFFLEETSKRGIVIQLTLWDHFDLQNPDHPWLNNITQTQERFSGRSDFYGTLDDNYGQGLEYQQKFVDRILEFTLDHDHVLYNINNEGSEGAPWENYWAQYIKRVASERNREIYVTAMQFDPSNTVRHIMTNSDIYDFYDVSQNNQDSRGGRGQGHWDNLMNWRKIIASHGIMPMTNVKVYGGLDGRNYSAGTESEAIDRFWRNIFAGCASARFHRPALLAGVWGSGLNERVQTNLKAMNMFLDAFDIFSASPHNDLLRHRVAAAPSTMEAYVTANIGKQYAVYFPPGRFKIDLDPWIYADQVKIRWLDIDQLSWSDEEMVDIHWDGSRNDWGDRGTITLKTPSQRPYVALVEIVEYNR